MASCHLMVEKQPGTAEKKEYPDIKYALFDLESSPLLSSSTNGTLTDRNNLVTVII